MAMMKVGRTAVLMIVAAAGAHANAQQGQAPGLTGNPGVLFGTDNYPPEAMRNGEQGRTVAKLLVGPDGRVTACAVDVSSGSKSLDDATCRIALNRVRFAPARDEQGRAIASSYTLPVRWVLPEDDTPRPRLSSDVQVKFDISADDRLLGCKLLANGKIIPGDDKPCKNWLGKAGLTLRALKGELGAAHVVVTSQHAIQFEGAAPITTAHVRPGLRVLGMMQVRVDVAPDGTVGNPRVIQREGSPPSISSLVATLGSFDAVPGRTDQLVLTESVSAMLVR